MARLPIIMVALVIRHAAAVSDVIDVNPSLPTAPPVPTVAVASVPTAPLVVSDASPLIVTPTVAPVGIAGEPTNPTADKEISGGASSDNDGLTTDPTANPQLEKAQGWANKQSLVQFILVCIFSVIYKFKVVDIYPELVKPNAKSAELQSENEVQAVCNNCFSPNCLLAWCCHAPRAAHTFDKTDTLPFWVGCVAMLFCPACTLCYTNSCTDMNEKLGGEKRNCCMSMLCAWCCMCCVVLQDAESLDAATGVQTQCLGVEGDVEAGDSSAEE